MAQQQPQQGQSVSNEHNRKEHEAKIERMKKQTAGLTNDHNKQEHEAKIEREKQKDV